MGIGKGAVMRKRTTKVGKKTPCERVMAHLLATADPARLFELYYWAQEPALLGIIRACATLPEAHLSALEAFFSGAKGEKPLVVNFDQRGQLVLSFDPCESGTHLGRVLDFTLTRSRAQKR
jgi:hypothetical protein